VAETCGQINTIITMHFILSVVAPIFELLFVLRHVKSKKYEIIHVGIESARKIEMIAK
jgi:hypothetical protein